MRPISCTAAAAAAAAVLSLAACGDDGGSASGPGAPGGGDGNTVVVRGDDAFQFDQDTYTSTAGEITFEYVNTGSAPHTLLIEDVDDFKLHIGSRDTGSVELDPGDYVLWCDIAGHRQAGMVADLIVE